MHLMGQKVAIFTHCLGDMGSIPVRTHGKDSKILLDISFHKSLQYEIGIREK